MRRRDRVVGAVLGSAVGDALGAPFEFGPAGAFGKRFPEAAGKRFPFAAAMCGGGGWEPGEATDDTQMAVHLGESLLDAGGLDLPDIFERFRGWAAADPKDIGILTECVLGSGLPWDLAAQFHFRTEGRAAGNGALMRAVTAAVRFAPQGRDATMDAARRITALTHGDGAAWEGTAILHELLRRALDGDDPQAAVPSALAAVRAEHRERWAVVLGEAWHPSLATESNGAVWPCLGSAVWALRTTVSFRAALRAAVDLGGDTDTVAAVTGALAGAVYGVDAIPEEWSAVLHVPLPPTRRVLGAGELAALAVALDVAGRVAGRGGVPTSR
ncbi:ADP-ribosylglycohydrolase family protein [Kitasatospora sp. CB01950]|uniref:ADP-ribosylglycohydrolase family protein n=1 Tax=Kitasatospora sp. CB01950 TaxID=1703930 RepID=UPI00093E2749|nr:ADP-ribosylglycohydrolase family protein [Kitasatospora sp. CB01950]OKJ01156.1 ribosylglycohydrolase [Kitasatospora sp. CB01950]